MAKIEEARNNSIIKSSLQAKVELILSKSDKSLFENLVPEDLFITSEVDFITEEIDEPKVNINSASGNKCGRCWKILPEVKVDGICKRCSDVIKKHYS